MRWTTAAFLSAGLIVAAVAGPANAEDFAWSGALQPGDVLTIRVVRGNIVAKPSANGRIEVVGRMHRSRASVDVKVVEATGAVTICTTRPGNDRCPGGTDRRHADQSDARVDFLVLVPAGVQLTADTEIGTIEVQSLNSPVDARTVQGDIEISTSAYAQARAINGDIWASVGSTDWSGAVEFETVNGNIEVRLPTDANTELHATSTTGNFETDLFPVQKPRYGVRIPGADVAGTIGKGGRRLRISTTNGWVHLERAR